ncbi:hypothetical protein INT48_000082 [Thamnidium elegans]|uniref:Elongation factor 1 alpha-like protein n=1 Tax=Thamnidium elegans TaxID=101142 RepID=A0A8H7SEE2_9FUNG|nr:hypothetical protein INT48_000082 [Thamnidium elegans]
MSRHRAVRNLDIDDILQEDDYDSEYDEDAIDETAISTEDLETLEEALTYIYSIIGEDTILSEKEIKETLWNSYFDTEETLNWALEKIEKVKAIEEKKKAKEEAKKASQAKPVSSLQSLAQRNSIQKTIPSSTNSLSHLASRTSNNALGSLASLAKKQPTTKPILTHTPPVKPPPVIKPQVVVVKEEKEEEIMENALIAKPSTAAQFLFQDLPTHPTSLEPVSSKVSTIPVFTFNQPSPDDIVLSAQNQPTAEKKAAAAAAAVTAAAKPKSSRKEEDPVEFLSDEEDLSQEMSAMGFKTHSEPLAKIPSSKRVNVLEEFEKRSGAKPKLNLVVIGHVDAGKSTLMGHFLYALGQVNERTMKKFERDSQKIGKGSFAFAWVLDETGEERDRGITMDIATNHFETQNKSFTLMDAPGHRDFIPNMISGTAQADAAILVVDASINAFEAGFDAGGQTKEHAVLARSLGVQQLIVAINKLDTVSWNEARFKEVQAKLGAYLVQVGFKKNNVVFVPLSGLTGENLVKKSEIPELTSWYKGTCLLDQIDKFSPPMRLLDRPLRMRVTDFFKGGIGSSGGVSVAGNIESGTIQVGEQIMIVPGGEIGYVKTMQVNEEPATWAAAGDSILMTLVQLDILNLSNGCIVCTPSRPVPVTGLFEAQIVVFDIRIPITPGYPVVLHHGSLDEPAFVYKLIEVLDKSTGQVIKNNPRCLTKGMTAKIQIKLSQRPIPLETFKDNKQLGRIMLRKDGETVAAGVVNEILTFGS